MDERKTLKWKLARPYWVARRIIEDTPREIKYSIQRAIRGYSISDLWSLDYAIARKVLPMLKAFRKMERAGIPTNMFEDPMNDHSDEDFKKAEKKFNDILDKMIYAFTFILYEDDKKYSKYLGLEYEEGSDWRYKEGSHEAAYEKHNEGLKLFGEHFRCLWD